MINPFYTAGTIPEGYKVVGYFVEKGSKVL